jgi:hypothetical protein
MEVCSRQLHDLVGTTIQDRFQHVEREAFCHFSGDLGRHGQLHPVDDGVDEHRTGMGQGFGDLAVSLCRILDANTFNSGRT